MAQALHTVPALAQPGAISAGQICHQPASSSPEADAGIAAQAKTKGCPAHVLAAIYGKNPANKAQEYDHSLKRWWVEYADRKNDEEDEHVADSLLYDKRHLPRTAPAPEGVMAAIAADMAAAKARAAMTLAAS